MKRVLFSLATIISLLLYSCDDTTDTIGMSLTDPVNNISVSSDSFRVESHSVKAKDIVSYTATGYLGKVKDPETGMYTTCNYMSQFITWGDDEFPPIDSLYMPYADSSQSLAEQVEADSCSLIVYFDDYYGDTLALMKVVTHELDKAYSEGVLYKTDFDPMAEGYVRTDDGSLHSQITYSVSNQQYPATGAKSFQVPLNQEYTDKDGVTYNNYGTYLMRKFYNEDSKRYFSNNYLFKENICPGLYLQLTGGLGSLGSITLCTLTVSFTMQNDSTTEEGMSYFLGTEEVLQKTYIEQDDNMLSQLVDDQSCTYLKTPAGIFTELTLPIEDIVLGRDDDSNTHMTDTLNTVRLFVPRINDNNSTDYNISVPTTLLMVPTDSADVFFTNHEVADFRDTYTASYSSTNNGFTFANISQLVSNRFLLVQDEVNNAIENAKTQKADGKLTTEEERSVAKNVIASYKENHPNWDKVMLIPVETTYSTLSSGSSILTKVTYDMNLTSTRLVKGDKDNDNIVVSVIYSEFTK